MGTLHPQYITDADGNRISVLLPLEEFETLFEDLQDLEDAMKVLDEPTVSWETVKAKLGIERPIASAFVASPGALGPRCAHPGGAAGDSRRSPRQAPGTVATVNPTWAARYPRPLR